MRDSTKSRLGVRVEFDQTTKDSFDYLKLQGFNMTQLIKNFINAKASEIKKAEQHVNV
jgi:hypothetical protein